MSSKKTRRAQRAPTPVVPTAPTHRWRGTLRAVVVAGGVVGLGVVGAVGAPYIGRLAARPHAAPQTPAASFVGSRACASCHASESARWSTSQHRAAMADASDTTVLGNFANAHAAYAGIATSFTRRNGKYLVKTDGPEGKPAEFEVKYTFGVQPLQQYLVSLPGGRLQALPFAWDSRPTTQQGQRWFHLYPHERVTHTDELHWTKASQNWNFMCADCHSTGLRKNYDQATDSYRTSWSEVSVGCEACHGPGSRHVTWAAQRATSTAARRDSTMGLAARLDERHGVAWTPVAATGNAVRSRPRTSDREIETCAQCHARRSQIADGYEAGKPFLDYYRPALLSRPLYHADGQQRDEVYTWGSFLQSRMYARGVTCSDCHDPHSGKPRAPGNAVCATCHQPAKYDTPAHHRHQVASAGASCVGCHMPATTYMVVDPRHDHSLRVPRPDLSVALGTPNACTSCHTQRDANWAAAQVRAWYGPRPPSATHERVARTFAAVDGSALDAPALLRSLAGDHTQSAIARASAFAELGPPPSGDALDALGAGLRDSSALVRLGALQTVEQLPLETRVRLAQPLLSDPVRAVRIEAVRLLAPMQTQALPPDERLAFQRASDEFVATQRYNADRAEAHVNLGTFLAERGDVGGAEKEMTAAIRLGPSTVPAYVNLADVYRAQGRDVDGERVLRQGLAKAPESGALHYALGLVLTRLQRKDTALHEFARAAGLEPGNARFAYVHAVALHSSGKVDAAIARLKESLTTHPSNTDILSALAAFTAARGDTALAKHYRAQLAAIGTGR